VSFSPRALRATLDRILREGGVPPGRWCVALSGGLDSTVLLAALAASRAEVPLAGLRAIHVDHGLHPDSALWSERCQSLSARLGVDCAILRIDAAGGRGDSPEAAARAARYAALKAALQPGEVLLTAHHADDQLEGVLLQWLRGGGLRAIAGMRPLAPFGSGWHARPMLGFVRDDLSAWADQEGLSWLEDPSNRDLRFDRNYLRHEVLPGVRRRWPAAARTIGRVGEQAAELLTLDAESAAADLLGLCEGATLSLAGLRPLAPARQRRALRAWLAGREVPLPAAATLEALRRDMLAASPDRVPETRWPGAVVHRYRGRLYADRPDLAAGSWAPGDWRPGDKFELGAAGRLELRATTGSGLSRARLSTPLRVARRSPGSRFQPAGSTHRRVLGKWLQDRGVLPWLRAQLPLVYAGQELVAVGDLAYGSRAAAAADEPSWEIVWSGRPALTEDEVISAPPHRPMQRAPEVAAGGTIR